MQSMAVFMDALYPGDDTPLHVGYIGTYSYAPTHQFHASMQRPLRKLAVKSIVPPLFIVFIIDTQHTHIYIVLLL